MNYEEKLKWTRQYRLKMKSEGPQCSKCERKGIMRKKLCDRCYSYQRFLRIKNDPKWREKKKEHARNTYRKKHDLPLDIPLLVAPAGKGTLNHYGYRVLTVKNHPNSMKNGRMLEHVYVMSNHLGRPLIKGETVHHKNGIADDNRIENLELWHRSHPPGQRVEDKIKWAIKFLESYGYKITK